MEMGQLGTIYLSSNSIPSPFHSSNRMSVSAIFGTSLVLPPPSSAATKASPRLAVGGGLLIECSSRPQKKATKHHMKTRPRKSRPSDIRHGPAVYPPLPPLPPEWTLVSDAADTVPTPQPAVQSE